MVVVIVRDEGDVDHLWVVASGDGVLVGKGLAANWQRKSSVQNWVCDDGFAIKLAYEANVPKSDKLAIFEGICVKILNLAKGALAACPLVERALGG